MSWPSKIFNAAKGKKFGLKITDQNAALVTDTRTPPVANSTERIFRQFQKVIKEGIGFFKGF